MTGWDIFLLWILGAIILGLFLAWIASKIKQMRSRPRVEKVVDQLHQYDKIIDMGEEIKVSTVFDSKNKPELHMERKSLPENLKKAPESQKKPQLKKTTRSRKASK